MHLIVKTKLLFYKPKCKAQMTSNLFVHFLEIFKLQHVYQWLGGAGQGIKLVYMVWCDNDWRDLLMDMALFLVWLWVWCGHKTRPMTLNSSKVLHFCSYTDTHKHQLEGISDANIWWQKMSPMCKEYKCNTFWRCLVILFLSFISGICMCLRS